MRVEKILIVRLAGIGDVVMASTVVPRIRATSPGATIHWLCGRTAAPLVERFHGVDVVLTLDEHRLLRGGVATQIGELAGVWRRIVAAGYTRVLLLHVDRRYRVLVAPLVLTGAKLSVLSRRDAHGAMNPVPGRSLSDEYARLVDGTEHRGPIAPHAPLAAMRGSDTVRRVSADGRRRIGLVPGGTKNVLRESALKRWPADRYADVARALIADGHDVVLVGDSGDEWAKPFFTGLGVTDTIGRTTLPDTVSVLASCDLVISHDTGPLHLARLAGTPVLALFGPTMPSQFAPPDATTTVLWGGEHLACRPCYDGREFAVCADNQCMTSISVDIVLRTVRTILSSSTRAIPDPPTPRSPSETAAR